jgi:DNA-binding NarL/FixJ family response regulator
MLWQSGKAIHENEIESENCVMAGIMRTFAKESHGSPRGDKPLLSDREKQVVLLVVQSQSNREIGQKLFISDQTVKNHLHKLFDKLGVSDRLELALYAIHHRLIEHELATSR